MQINKVNNISFGKIIEGSYNPVPQNLLYKVKEKADAYNTDNNFNPIDFMDGKLLSKVIESDYNTPSLQKRYKQLVEEQESNPHHVHLGLYLADKNEIPLYPEGWYQQATVGNKIFKQRVYAYQGTTIGFLEKACKYANKLKSLNIEPEDVKKSPSENPYIIKLLNLCKTAKEHFKHK